MTDLTLQPIVVTTRTERQHPGDPAPDCTAVVETSYRLNETDTLWLGLGSLTVTRGDRYAGTEEVLRVEIYSCDRIRDAICALIIDQRGYLKTEKPGSFLRDRAESFFQRMRDLLPEPLTPVTAEVKPESAVILDASSGTYFDAADARLLQLGLLTSAELETLCDGSDAERSALAQRHGVPITAEVV